MLKDKATSLVDCIQTRGVKVFKDTTSPLSKLKNFQSSVENKTVDFNKQSNKFLFGRDVYIRSRATKSKTKGLLEMKDSAKRLRDNQLYEEPVAYFTDVNDFSSFLVNALPPLTDLVNKRATITREFNLDMQSKGPMGATVRRNAKRKRDERLKTPGIRTIFVPLVRKILDVNPDFKVWFIRLYFSAILV